MFLFNKSTEFCINNSLLDNKFLLKNLQFTLLTTVKLNEEKLFLITCFNSKRCRYMKIYYQDVIFLNKLVNILVKFRNDKSVAIC